MTSVVDRRGARLGAQPVRTPASAARQSPAPPGAGWHDETMRERLEALGRMWRRAPKRVRQTIVVLLGSTVVLLGLALIVLPGPFTLPLLILGFAILGTEFAWAASALERTRAGVAAGGRVAKRAVGAAADRGGRVIRRRGAPDA
jgi:hypothetical protein